MYFIYSLVFTLGFVILLPRFLLDAFRHGKYIAGFNERLGRLPTLDSQARPVVWLHCVSVGETQAARPLVDAIRRRFPDHQLVVSTVTATGQELARQVFKDDAARVFYFPFDWRWTARRTLKAINPCAVLILETELWPGFLRECKTREIPVVIVNGRLSETSFRRFKLVPAFISQVVNCLELALMQTEADAGRMRDLGLKPDRLVVSGNLKFDAVAIHGPDTLTEELRTRFSFDDSAPVILAASTHAPEERIILEVFRQLAGSSGVEKPRLVIAPRHPERFAEVAALLTTMDLRWVRRTDKRSPNDRDCEVLLLDSIGELRSVFPLAAVVFVGGSFAPTGGHNILEPAAVGSCIVTGPHTENFKDVVRTFVDAGAIIQLQPFNEEKTKAAVTTLFQQLIDEPARRLMLGARAKELVEQNRGATERTVDLLAGILATFRSNTERSTTPIAPEGAPSS
jgi:3-deoxy-D-manno-octulosonic-acid transferase